MASLTRYGVPQSPGPAAAPHPRVFLPAAGPAAASVTAVLATAAGTAQSSTFPSAGLAAGTGAGKNATVTVTVSVTAVAATAAGAAKSTAFPRTVAATGAGAASTPAISSRAYYPSAGVSLLTGAYTSGGKLVLPCVAVYSEAASGSILNLTGSACDIRVDGVPPLGNGSTEAQFRVAYDLSNYFMIWYGDNSAGLTCRLCQAAVNTDHLFVTTYSGTTHKYWRIRVSGATVYFGTSPDRSSWTEYSATHTLGTTLVTTMRLYLRCGYWSAETSPGPATIGAVNAT